MEQTELLTVVELAARLKCSPSFLYRHTQKHTSDPIPVATWLGNRPRFRFAEVEAWLQARKPSQDCVNLADGSVAARDKQMSRRCHQEGHVRLRDDVKRPYWQGLYRVRSEGQPGGKWKSENLGYKDEISKRQAQRRLQAIISKVESEIVRLPRSVMTVSAYVEDHYTPEFVSKRKPSTRKAYLQIIKAHIVPTLGATELNHVGGMYSCS